MWVSCRDRVSGWTLWSSPYIRSIGNSYAARLAILIPLIGYWIIFNDFIVQHVRLWLETIGLSADEPQTVPWRLLKLYFGLCFIALATVIYRWRCPEQVKLYATASEYIAALYDHISQLEEGEIERALKTGDALSRRQVHELRAIEMGSPSAENIEEHRRRAADTKRNQMDLYYQLLNRSRLLARLATVVFYAVGFSFVLWPSLWVFWRVASILWKGI